MDWKPLSGLERVALGLALALALSIAAVVASAAPPDGRGKVQPGPVIVGPETRLESVVLIDRDHMRIQGGLVNNVTIEDKAKLWFESGTLSGTVDMVDKAHVYLSAISVQIDGVEFTGSVIKPELCRACTISGTLVDGTTFTFSATLDDKAKVLTGLVEVVPVPTSFE